MKPNVLVAVTDLLLSSKIKEACKHLELVASPLKKNEQFLTMSKNEKPDLIILDLDSSIYKPLEILKKLKEDKEFSDIPVISFFAHTHLEIQKNAMELGYNQILPRSAFFNNLPELLKTAIKKETNKL